MRGRGKPRAVRAPVEMGPRTHNGDARREIARVVRAAKRAGGVDRVQISFDDGTNINLILADASKDNGNSNPWDEVLTDAADQKRPA